MLSARSTAALTGVVAFLFGAVLLKSVQQRKELVESYERQLSTLRETIATQEKQLSERTDEQVVIRENIIERKANGTVREIRRERESVSSKKTEVVENSTQATKEASTVAESAKKSEVVAPSDSRLGLDLSVGVRLDATELGDGLMDALHWQADVSYEMGYRLAPRLGVEFDSTFGAPTSYTLGVEVRL